MNLANTERAETDVQEGVLDRSLSMKELTEDISSIAFINTRLVDNDIVSAVAMENMKQKSSKIDDHKPTGQQNCKLYVICSLILLDIITSMAIGFGIHACCLRP
jgi:hypothetical protein